MHARLIPPLMLQAGFQLHALLGVLPGCLSNQITPIAAISRSVLLQSPATSTSALHLTCLSFITLQFVISTILPNFLLLGPELISPSHVFHVASPQSWHTLSIATTGHWLSKENALPHEPPSECISSSTASSFVDVSAEDAAKGDVDSTVEESDEDEELEDDTKSFISDDESEESEESELVSSVLQLLHRLACLALQLQLNLALQLRQSLCPLAEVLHGTHEFVYHFCV
jgi:hypothetical protein